jgi:DNA repair protein SbcD/Mre11
MRIVHTSDWHAGRIWKNVNRLAELGDVFEHLGDFIEHERIDVLLVSGDVFDTGAPAAEAERLVFRFLKRVGGAGTQSIVIAGNHDNPARVDAWGTLAELVQVHVVGRPRPADQGGVIDLVTRANERAVIAAIPFAPPRLLISALELADDETRAKSSYAERFKEIMQRLCTRFRQDAVNLVTAHTHLDGAVFSGSERTVHLGEEWAATPQALPSTAHYVALGHIHKPQKVMAAPAPTQYAGSPLQLDFGEEGEEKSFVMIDAQPGRPAHVERVQYKGAKPLVSVRKTLAELERDAETLAQAGWLRVTVSLSQPEPEINGRVRRLLSNAVIVAVELPPRPDAHGDRPPAGTQPDQLYRAYFVREHEREPEPTIMETFNILRNQTAEA